MKARLTNIHSAAVGTGRDMILPGASLDVEMDDYELEPFRASPFFAVQDLDRPASRGDAQADAPSVPARHRKRNAKAGAAPV
jgi:hypothetical protein